MKRFRFADAFWFRRPMKSVVVIVAAFAVLSIQPALTGGTPEEHERALFGLTVLAAFMLLGTSMWVAIDDSYVDLDEQTLRIHFEGFFNAEFPVRDIVRVSRVDPHPRWRYRFGLSTNFQDRIACSHGGPMIQIDLATPWRTRLWPRHVDACRFWIAVREHRALWNELRTQVPHAFDNAGGLPQAFDDAGALPQAA